MLLQILQGGPARLPVDALSLVLETWLAHGPDAVALGQVSTLFPQRCGLATHCALLSPTCVARNLRELAALRLLFVRCCSLVACTGRSWLNGPKSSLHR